MVRKLIVRKRRKNPLNKLSEQQIEDYCIKWLARREHSELELQRKLAVKGYTAAQSLPVIEDLQDRGLQSNQRFAECYIRSRLNQGNGPFKISHELLQRGIGKDETASLFKRMAINWADEIRCLYRRKYAETDRLTKKEWAGRVRFLQQRGFDLDLIRALFDDLAIQLPADDV